MEFEEESLITNFKSSDLPKYVEALTEYEFRYPDRANQIYIKEDAFDSMGKKIPDTMSLHSYESDLSDFWNIFEIFNK